MRRVMILFVALLGLLLTACAPATTPAPTPVPPQPTAEKVQPTAPQATESAAQPAGTAAPVATPDMEKVLNPQPDDHKRGPDGAPVTIIEWGDFQ